jgi:ABC-type dipeptide/oligopeptide/nickel transport system permease component
MKGLALIIARRLMLLVPVVLLVVTTVFLLVHLVPGDPARLIVGDNASEETYQMMRSRMRLDRPLLDQYVAFWREDILTGELGRDYVTNQPNIRRIMNRYPATIQLAVASLVIVVLVSVPLGIAAATHRGGLVDASSTLVALLGISLPSFALGPLLILLFSVALRLTPVSGSGDLRHLILPAATLGFALSAVVTRMVRSSVIEELGEDYVRTARAKGLSERRVLYKHVLKNSLIPVVTILGLQFGVLLAGAIVTEVIFSWQGVGSLLIESIFQRNYSLTQGCILMISITYVFVNTATDILYRWLDPRVTVE